MKYFIVIILLVCSQAFSQTEAPVDPTTSDSLEEDIVGTITPPTQEHTKVAPPKAEPSKKSLKNQLKKKPKTKKQKEKHKDKKNKKNKKNKKHKSKDTAK